MILIVSFFIIIICAIVAIVRSEKPLKHIMAETKYELIYNAMGSRALLEDIIMKRKNKTELPLRSGQIAVITGGSRGIGVEIVKMLMKCDMHIIIGCRNISAGEKIESMARKEGIKSGEVECHKLDTGSMKSVKLFSKIIIEKFPKIHVLINNAGIMFVPFAETEDGFESHFAVNYLGHFYLTHMLLPLLKAAGEPNCNARIVNVSSCANLAGVIDFEDISMEKQYIASAAYAQSKLAQILSSNYLNTLMNEKGYLVQANSVHPGIVNTDLFNDTPLKKIFPWIPGLIFKTPIQGATPVVYCAVSPKLEGKGGTYISNCRNGWVNSKSNNVELQEELFKFTNKLLKIEEFGISDQNFTRF